MKNPFSGFWKSVADPFGDARDKGKKPVVPVTATPARPPLARESSWSNPPPASENRTLDIPPARERTPEPVRPAPVVYEEVPAEEEKEQPPQAYDDCKQYIEDNGPDGEFFTVAVERLLTETSSVEDFLWLFKRLEETKFADKVVTGLLAIPTHKFEDLKDAYNEVSSTSDFSRALLKMAIEKASADSEWVELASIALNTDDDDVKAVKAAIEGLRLDLKGWDSLRDALVQEHDNSSDDFSDFIDLATRKQLGFYDTALEVLNFFCWYTDGDNSNHVDYYLKDEILDKLFDKATRQEVQIISALAGYIDDDNGLKEAADEFLKS